jgi:hypothetical protein
MSDVYGLRGSTGVAAAGGGNPLVVGAVDTATPFSGTRLIEDGAQIIAAVKNGDWLSGTMAGAAAIGDALQLAFNPIAGVVSWVVGWILDHVEPLKGWLNELTGDAGEVSAASATWSNIAVYLQSAADELFDSLNNVLAEQTSQAVDAYKRLMADSAEHVRMSSGLADGISTGLTVAATIVQIVHDLVRDAISDIIGQFVSAAAQALLSLGTLVPKIVADIAAAVTKWVGRISTKIDDVIRSFDKLNGLFKKIDPLLAKLKNIFNQIGGVRRRIDNIATDAGHRVGQGLRDRFILHLPDEPFYDGIRTLNLSGSHLDELRSRWSISDETKTVAVGKTDVRGMEGLVFQGGSPGPRTEAHLGPLDANRPIQSPFVNNPQATRHAEEALFNQFDAAVRRANLDPGNVTGTINMLQSNPKGICPSCLSGLDSDKLPGVIKQFSERYPNLEIHIGTANPTGRAVGRFEVLVRNGRYV